MRRQCIQRRRLIHDAVVVPKHRITLRTLNPRQHPSALICPRIDRRFQSARSLQNLPVNHQVNLKCIHLMHDQLDKKSFGKFLEVEIGNLHDPEALERLR